MATQPHLVVGSLRDRGGTEVSGAGGVARHPVLQQEAQEEDQRHHDVAHGVEDDGSLWVPEPAAGGGEQN